MAYHIKVKADLMSFWFITNNNDTLNIFLTYNKIVSIGIIGNDKTDQQAVRSYRIIYYNLDDTPHDIKAQIKEKKIPSLSLQESLVVHALRQ